MTPLMMTATWWEERARLRTLLEEASARPWVARDEWIDGSGYDEVLLPAQVDCMAYCYGGTSHVEYGTEHDQAVIVAAVNALPGLLDALDAAEETSRQHLLREDLLRGQVADLEAERDALLDTIERVRALHGPTILASCRSCAWSAYPCPTLRALDGGQ